jgi:hypothetical protein
MSAIESKLCDEERCVASPVCGRVPPASSDWREFPAFLAYTVVHIGRAAIFVFAQRSRALPQYSYWLSESLDVSLAFLLVRELYGHVLLSYPALRRFSRVLVRWSASVLLLAAAAAAAGMVGKETSRLASTLVALDWCAAILKSALVLLLFHFARLAGLTWQHYALGIGIGLAAYTALDTALLVLQTHAGLLRTAASALLNSASFNCSVLIWIVWFFRRRPSSPSRSPAHRALAEWDAELQALLRRD